MTPPTPDLTRARARLSETKADVAAALVALRKARRAIEAERRRLDEAASQLAAAEQEELRAERRVSAMTWNKGGVGLSGAHDQQKTKTTKETR